MSISASYIVLAVLILRPILKKAPKWMAVALWGIVAIRLVCPISIESMLSLIPSAETVSPDIMTDDMPAINSGITILNNSLNPVISESFAPNPGDSANPLQIWIPLLAAIWALGAAAMLVYTAISYLTLKRKIGTAVLYKDGIYQSESVLSPFVLGIIKPRIYMPFSISEGNMEHVIFHERAHISRKDHLWKPLGFMLLALHWFNPLMWAGYILLCRDIELACDEKVIKELGHDERADYSEALLTCSVNRRMIAACPLAFGEVGVKARVKSVLNYKKPAFWIIIAAVTLCIVTAVCFLTNPIDKDNIGIKDISAKSVDSDTVELKIKYSYPTGGYKVYCVGDSTLGYSGDGIIPYVGALGKYRILIEFGDTEPSKEIAEQFPAGKAVELEGAPVKMRVMRVHPQDHGFFLYVGFDHPVEVDTVENGEFKSLWGSVKIKIKIDSSVSEKSVPPNCGETDPDKMSERQKIVFERFPEYFGLDASRGLDVYVWQMSKNSYYFGLLPGSVEAVDYWKVQELRGTDANDMRTILSTYDLDEKYVQIIPMQKVISSYLADWQIIREGEDREKKVQEYIEYIRLMLFGVGGENNLVQRNCELLYFHPACSYVMSPSLVPSLTVEDGAVYNVSGENKVKLGKAEKITLDESNLDSCMTFIGSPYEDPDLARELRKENMVTYELIPDAYVEGIEIYYIMEQSDGDVIIVYGHYENGAKNNFIRFIYRFGN